MLLHIIPALDTLETTYAIQVFNGHELQSGLWCETSPAFVVRLGGEKNHCRNGEKKLEFI